MAGQRCFLEGVILSQALQVEIRRSHISGYVNSWCKGPEERRHEAYLWSEVKRAQCLRHRWVSEGMNECMNEKVRELGTRGIIAWGNEGLVGLETKWMNIWLEEWGSEWMKEHVQGFSLTSLFQDELSCSPYWTLHSLLSQPTFSIILPPLLSFFPIARNTLWIDIISQLSVCIVDCSWLLSYPWEQEFFGSVHLCIPSTVPWYVVGTQ